MTTTQKIALLFPGQGAQYVGMGKDIYDASPVARDLLDRADAALGGGFLDILFNGPADELTATRNSQPAIYAVSCAVHAALAERMTDVAVVAAAGLSLGEYSALTAGGALDFDDGIRLVRRRGELMQQAGTDAHGAMASILGLDAEKVDAACAPVDGVWIANYNCPGQIVISGTEGGVARASAACDDAGARRVIPLQVSGAFHCPLMSAARDGLAPLLDDTAWSTPAFPVLANVTGVPYQSVDDIPATLARQVVESVRWEDDCRWMLLQGVETFFELGPGTVLAGLMRKIERAATVHSVESLSAMESL